jgi:RNA polymerase sigma factor (sigma-70 family)
MATAERSALLWQVRRLTAERGRPRTDWELLEEFAARRSEAAFAALVERHGPMVLRVCRRVLRHEQDAEDAFQATFLVLARSSASIRKREALASWLHGVAHRTAMKAKRSAARRRDHEGRRAAASPAAPGPRWDEVQAALDEEVRRLPERYRSAFVLCCLEGRGRPEAAAALGVKEGTVWSRLARARRLLRQRLTRRGIELAALLAALAVAEGAGAARVPPPLARVTIRSGLSVAAGDPTAGIVPPHVSVLATGVTRAMDLSRVKIVVIALLVAGLALVGAGAWARQALAAPPEAPPAQPAAKPAAPPQPAGERVGRIEFRGRVLAPDGKPVAGAKVLLLDYTAPAPPVRATSAADGSYRFALAAAEVKMRPYVKPWEDIYVAASAEGFGLGLAAVGKPGPAVERDLRLARDDVAIRGRVLTLEGRPAPGARATVFRLMLPKGADDLTPFLKALDAGKEGISVEYNLLTVLEHPGLVALFPAAVADREGRFEVRGLGRERVAGLTMSGPTIATAQVRVRTRPGQAVRRPEWKDFPDSGRLTYHGATFEHTAGPTRPVSGVVREKGSGKPVAGATVESVVLAGTNYHGRTFVRTTADRAGHYRLVGLPPGAGNLIRAMPPEGRPYLSASRPVPAPEGLTAVAVDFELPRGVWVEGKVTDKVTGRPVTAGVEYFAFRDNPHLKGAPGQPTHRQVHTGEDGSFRFLTLPGHGLVAVRAHGDRYLIGVGLGKLEVDGNRYLPATTPPCHAEGHHAFVQIDPKAEGEKVTCAVALDPGRALTGTVLGPDGEPLAGAKAAGLSCYAFTGWDHTPLKGAEFTAFALSKGRPRNLLFLHEGKRLAGSLMLQGDETGPLTVRLRPWGAVSGRVVGPDGLARAKLELTTRRFGERLYDARSGYHPTRSFETDTDGRFRIEGLVPGLPYEISVMRQGRIVGRLARDLTVKSGESRDLGEVQFGD